MKIKFSFLERDFIGIGVYRIQYETNLQMEDVPGFAKLKERIEERILLEFGTTLEEAKEDKAYTMDFIVRKKPQLGLSMPGDCYTLIITESGCVKRISKSFTIDDAGV